MITREQPTSTRSVRRFRNGDAVDVDDELVVEEPLEIRVGDQPFTVTMRTPGDDFDLARGLLFTEGLIASVDDIGQMRYCDSGEAAETDYDNIVIVRLRTPAAVERQWQRNLMSGTSCGLCGKSALEAVSTSARKISTDYRIDSAVLAGIPETMRKRQPIFDRTGGLHAAGIFDGSGQCLALFEDIGRHNATDKCIGRGVAEGWLPWTRTDTACVLLVSGRASFEITQKALVAGIPIVASVSAASSLAVDLASAGNQILVGFIRGSGMTVYAGVGRVR
jgi:FdhD protein